MALGNHPEKGNWALLVKEAPRKNTRNLVKVKPSKINPLT
jgi:hypothetical protein